MVITFSCGTQADCCCLSSGAPVTRPAQPNVPLLCVSPEEYLQPVHTACTEVQHRPTTFDKGEHGRQERPIMGTTGCRGRPARSCQQ